VTWTLLRLACRGNLFYDSVILSALLFFTIHGSLEIPSDGSSVEPALSFAPSFLTASQAAYENVSSADHGHCAHTVHHCA